MDANHEINLIWFLKWYRGHTKNVLFYEIQFNLPACCCSLVYPYDIVMVFSVCCTSIHIMSDFSHVCWYFYDPTMPIKRNCWRIIGKKPTSKPDRQ